MNTHSVPPLAADPRGWPADGGPRYVVGSLAGGTIGRAGRHGPEAYVYDRANCHRIVATVSDSSSLWRCKMKAAAIAAAWNEEA